MWALDVAPRRDDAPADSPAPAAATRPLADFGDTLDRTHPSDRERIDDAIRAASASGEDFDVEYRVVAPDGTLRWQAARGRTDPGSPRRLIGVVSDITQRKQAQAEAAQDHAALQHMTRVSLLGQLSASIAHQLNQPLTSILGNAEAAQLLLKREPLDVAELRAICADIVSEDHRAAAVIRRLVALFRHSPPSLAPLDVNELVHDTIELTLTNLQARQVTLVTTLAPDLPPLDGDRVQLQQMLLNLIVNAADAMDALPEPGRELTIATTQDGGTVCISVADRGPGFPAEVAHKLFEPFWSTKTEGMGIGLAVCRSIVAAHHGTLEAANAPGGGAVFRACLPARVAP
jgi:C4-dicarboxylate-specific signal transduction histidine kinase